MHVQKNGYVAGAALLIPFARQLRDHVEYEKFLCRVLVDNEITKEFEKKTEGLPNKLFAFRYNNINSKKLTASEKNNESQ